MSKSTLDVFKSKVEAIASHDLLATISGGTENASHDDVANPDNPIVLDTV